MDQYLVFKMLFWFGFTLGVAIAVFLIRTVKSILLLKELGFTFPSYPAKNRFWDPNDIAILTIYLIFIIPLAAAFCCLINEAVMKSRGYEIMVVWTPMAVCVGLFSTVSALYAKSCLSSSQNIYWKLIRPDRGRPWCSYFTGGIIAGLASIIGLVFLSYLNPEKKGLDVITRIRIYWEWSLVAFAVALSTGYHLDSSPQKKHSNSPFESFTTALSGVIAAAFALIAVKGEFSLEVVDM